MLHGFSGDCNLCLAYRSVLLCSRKIIYLVFLCFINQILLLDDHQEGENDNHSVIK